MIPPEPSPLESAPDVARSGNPAEAGDTAGGMRSGPGGVEPAFGTDSRGESLRTAEALHGGEAFVRAMTFNGRLWSVTVANGPEGRTRSTRAVAYEGGGTFVWEVHVGRRRKARGHDRSLAGAKQKAVAHALARGNQ